MTFSFDASLGTTRDTVRFLIGDTVDSGHLFENETIAALLVTQPNPAYTAATLAESQAALFARRVNKRIGKTSIDSSDLYKHWSALAARLREGGSADGTGMTAVGMTVGGISEDARDDLETGDSDRIQPSFSVGRDDATPDTLPDNARSSWEP